MKPPAPGRPSVFCTRGSQSMRTAWPASFAFSPGWSTTNVDRLGAVEALLRALVHAGSARGSPCSSRRRTPASSARRGDRARRRSTCPAASVEYVFALFAFQSAFVSVESVKQPTETSFRTAHGSSASAHAPMHSAGATQARRCQRTIRARSRAGGRAAACWRGSRARARRRARRRAARRRPAVRSATSSVR